ncbi:MAG: hypothetical protein [Bacteriophage sp.]|jgi:hypothetical protein|nr:hypothetical protein DWX32_11655 [Blautia sp. AF19-13LB]UVX69329.1 MAG: hypothetical protein [Bacteriophage sp.]
MKGARMKVLTSFTKLVTGEGIRIAYTYSEVDDSGDLISQNNRGNFVAVNPELKKHIAAIDEYIENNQLNKEEN